MRAKVSPVFWSDMSSASRVPHIYLRPGDFSNGDYFFALGFAEGFLSAKRMADQWHNMIDTKPDLHADLKEFLVYNISSSGRA